MPKTNTNETKFEVPEVLCGDCGRRMLYHPALSKFICVCCHDEAPQFLYDVEPYTGSDAL